MAKTSQRRMHIADEFGQLDRLDRVVPDIGRNDFTCELNKDADTWRGIGGVGQYLGSPAIIYSGVNEDDEV